MTHRPTCKMCGVRPAISKGIRAGKRLYRNLCSSCYEHSTPSTRDRVKRKKNRRKQTKKLWIREQKCRPCVDCGVEYDWWKMQFDHRIPGEKLFDIAHIHVRSWTTIRQELAKCDVLCAHCHLDRTHYGQHHLTTRGVSEELQTPIQGCLFN